MSRLRDAFARWKLRRGILSDPTAKPRLAPQAIVEQQRSARGYSAAIPAAGWTEDITKRNAEIEADYAAEVARRTALFERGEYIPRYGSVQADMYFDMRARHAVNVTGLQPREQPLTKEEFRDARTISGLTSEIQAIENSTLDRTVKIPARPSKQEVLDAAGGNQERAAQVEARLDELFGVEATS